MKLAFGLILFSLLTFTCCTKKINLQDRGCQAAPLFFTIDTNYYYFPNVFTPNGDGYNDIMFLYTNNSPENYWIEIRKNKKVIYENTNPSWGWDGTEKGRLQKDGTYSFSVRIIENGVERQAEGEITLITYLNKYNLNNCNNCQTGTPEPVEICK